MDGTGITRPYPQLPTSDLMGTLRLTRTGSSWAAWFWDQAGGAWTRIFALEGSQADFPVTLMVWSHRGLYSGERAQVTFSNFRVNRGTYIPAGGPAPRSGFDVSTVDLATLSLSGAPLAKKPNGAWHASIEDVNGDGVPDLLGHFSFQELALSSDATEITLTGSTVGGTPFRATHPIRIVP